MTTAKILLAVLFGFVLCLIIVLVVMAFRTLRRQRDKVLATLLTLAALAGQSAMAQEPIGSVTYNETLGAYEINCVQHLQDLSAYVRDGHPCAGLVFKMTADITIPHTTAWNDDSSTENNYTPIGYAYREGLFGLGDMPFRGTFDGCGHTVSGIRIYKHGEDVYSQYQGIIGVAENSTVQNVTLADARITAYSNVGGIVGFNMHRNGNSNTSTVSGCTSAAVFTIASSVSDVSQCGSFGGIVGQNDPDCTISDCTAAGVILPNLSDTYGGAGAIVGMSKNGGILTGNTYHSCLMGGTYAFNIGTGTNNYVNSNTYDTGDVSGATLNTSKLWLYDDRDNSALVAANYKQVRLYGTYAPLASTTGKWLDPRNADNRAYYCYMTICLPFAYTKGDEGTYYTFGGITKTIVESQPVFTATMNEVTAEALSANTPYLFVASGEGDKAVTFTGTAAATISAGESESGLWKFKGTYSRLTYGTEPMTGYVYGFASSNKTVEGKNVQAGEFVRAMTGAGVPPFRCYLIYNDGAQYKAARGVTRGETEELPSRIIVRLVGADGSTTAIGTMDTRSGEVSLEGWYDLNGRKLEGMPTRKGIYIHNGKKVII